MAASKFQMSIIKQLYSKNRTRLYENGFDLDLSFILKNVIAMSFPDSGIQAIARNSIVDVENYLESKFQDNYMVYNLADEKPYDMPGRFGNRVKRYPFPNHSAPDLDYLFKIVVDISQYLRQAKDHIAVIHCMAGKGRTGVVVCCYLIYDKICRTPDEAIDFFAFKRSADGSARVENPSQQRAIWQFYRGLYQNFFDIGCIRRWFRIIRIILADIECDKLLLYINDSKIDLIKNGLEYTAISIQALVYGDVILIGELGKKQVFCLKTHTEFLDYYALCQVEDGEQCICVTMRYDYLDCSLKAGVIKLYFEKCLSAPQSARRRGVE